MKFTTKLPPILYFMVLFSMPLLSNAKIQLAPLFNNGMVLQQQSKVRIWGWATQYKPVKIKNSWNKQVVYATPTENGKWEAFINTPIASYEPRQVIISNSDTTITISDVLIGEVWVGGGQSNMEMSIAGSYNRVIENPNNVLLQSKNYTGKVRLATVAHNVATHPVDLVKAQWQECTPGNIKPWSAACYFFAITLAQALDCPIGMISSCWGSTNVETWMPRETLVQYPDVDCSEDNLKTGKVDVPAIRYNGMIHPIQGYTIKGFIWYQGESNVKTASTYASKLGTMIKSWRSLWQQPELPFYQVEIAPFKYDGPDKISAALLREAQADVCKQVENVGIISTSDLVLPEEVNQIHPMMKRQVGERLAFLALNRTYNNLDYFGECPQYKSHEIKGKKFILCFENATLGFNRFVGFNGFEICGTDGKYYPAIAKLNGVGIEVSCKEVEHPVALRYCFKNFVIGNTTNVGGAPLLPFRTNRNY